MLVVRRFRVMQDGEGRVLAVLAAEVQIGMEPPVLLVREGLNGELESPGAWLWPEDFETA